MTRRRRKAGDDLGCVVHVLRCSRGLATCGADTAATWLSQVVAHRLLPLRFDRYKATLGYNSAINSRQFQADFQWPSEYRYPDETYDVSRVLIIGGVTFELYHMKGETDDATWCVWLCLCACDAWLCVVVYVSCASVASVAPVAV